MTYKVSDLKASEVEEIENMLDEYDEKHIKYRIPGKIQIGIKDGEKLIAGVDACMTDFKILYVSTVFVDEKYRRKGIGKKLLNEVEKRALKLGANIIRIDTYDWQGRDFYRALGYEEAGSYENKEDGFSEYFFLKRL
ncbi:MAG: GNAT family N-acetyltransferase [Clostridiaceae bacterium]|nr:GNAT family N-acetyltransferase [Clostridiaceae bacterium]